MTTKHNRLIVFEGGPLDGQTKHKGNTGRWPTYLAEDGETVIKPSEGDRWRRNGSRPVYVNRESMDVNVFPVMIHHTYVWCPATKPRKNGAR
jgi:hypothetical protein